jgi:signal transduction histidine kinase
MQGQFDRVRSPPSGSARQEQPLLHVVHFYEERAFPDASIADFLWAGLQAGDGVVMLTTAEHRTALDRSLTALGANVGALEQAGRLRQRHAHETMRAFMAGDLPDAARFRNLVGGLIDEVAAAAPSGQVRGYGECVALLADEQKLAASIEVERLLNDVLATRRCAFYCAYPLQLFAHESLAEPFLRLCDAHTEVIPACSLDDGPARHGRCVAALEQQARALEEQVAERRRAEASLRELAEERAAALRRLAEADRRKDEFLAMLGHELRNPLAPITTALELMDQRADPGCQRERAVIRRQAEHMKRLVDDLLDVSRVTRGKIELRKEPLELSTAVIRAVEMASPLLEQRAHAVAVQVPRAGLRVHADPFRLCQIVANLLTNAATYTDPGGRITVAARREGFEVVLDVTDTGRGIRADLLPRIFELFEQGERTQDRAQGGLGLGLPLSRMLAELHGGTVSARSEGPARGSTFTLRLPASPVAAAVAEPAPAPTRGVRLLLVDDNRDACDMLAAALRQAGYEVAVAYDGPEALAGAAETPPDVALLDIGLPVMDGYELASRLREGHHGGPLRLIALSGYGQEGDRERSKQVGFDQHLVKPVALDALLRSIEAE